MTPILSICIPTYNRADILDRTLKSIVKEEVFRETTDIEIVISDNCSPDNTKEVVEKYLSKFPDKIKYVRQENNIKDKNFATVLGYANGTFAKLHNDTLMVNKGGLAQLVEILKVNDDRSVVFFIGVKKDEKVSFEKCSNIEMFFDKVSFNATWIGGLCVNSKLYKTIENPARFSSLNFSQIDIITRMLSKNSASLVIYSPFFEVQCLKKKGGYNVAEVFGPNLIKILNSLKEEELISQKVVEKMKKSVLKKVINVYYFDLKNNCNFSKTGYFRHLFRYYKFCPYFYFEYLKILLKRLKNCVVKTQKTGNKRIIILFGFIKIRMKLNLKKRWKAENKHNFVVLSDYRNYDKIIVGENSYGCINALFSAPTNEKLYIGNYCSIADGVRFVVSSEHDYKNLSTYPFKVMLGGEKDEALSKGDIVLEDDVWIGCGAIVLSGVTIGQGAVVAGGAVVTKDVEPYAIVAGNPAKVIKYRFEPEIIEKLKGFDFSKLTKENALSVLPQLYTHLTTENVDRILKEVEN